jgi:hypothetical protein
MAISVGVDLGRGIVGESPRTPPDQRVDARLGFGRLIILEQAAHFSRGEIEDHQGAEPRVGHEGEAVREPHVV